MSYVNIVANMFDLSIWKLLMIYYQKTFKFNEKKLW